ncbi:MAG: hypothetical protein LW712_00715 [Burkholderiaceae bacterium]|nr:hypothetical protein [Burkholderiaceae bacterium]
MSHSGADGPPAFIEADAPTDNELHVLLQTVIARLMQMLTRQGVLVEDMGQTCLAELDANGEEARTLRPLQAAAVTYRIAFGPRAGQKLLTLRGAIPREDRARQPLCADIDGNSAACRGAGGSPRPQAPGAVVPLHHPPLAVGRTGAAQRRRPGRAQVQDAVARRHDASGDEPAGVHAAAAECEVESLQARPQRISWARLLKRVFDIDMHTCPSAGPAST